MKSLSAYRSNGRERQVTSMRLSHCFQCRSHLMLLHPDTQHTHCLQMHFSCHITCTFNLRNLFFRLIIPQIHNSFDKRNRRHLCSRIYPQQGHQLQAMFCPIRRKIMHRTLLCHHLLYVLLQFSQWQGFRYSHPLCLLV